MALPKIDLPRYKHHLVGINKDIKFRPFTLKEQKILLLAKQSENSEQMIEAVKQLISLCTDGAVNPDELPFFDVEDLFVRIRSKSVSEISELMYRDKETDQKYKVKINLDDVKVITPEDHTNKIMITDTIGMMMKYPTLDMIKTDENKTLDDSQLLKNCIDYIFDSSEMYYLKDEPEEVVNEWIDGLDSAALLKIEHFFKTMPRLRHEVTLKLSDGRSETLLFEGMESFFT